MNINATLIAQMITFALFVWFTMRFVWPPLTKMLDERQGKIADGLAAAERGHRELELAQHRITEELREAKLQTNEIIEQAHRRANQIVDEAKAQAVEEGNRLAKLAQEDIAQEVNRAREDLRQQVAALAVAGAERILQREIDTAANETLLKDLVKEL